MKEKNIEKQKTMNACVYHGKGKLNYEKVPIPEIGPREALLKVAICGLCKTDVKKIKNDLLKPPRIYGHEIVGKIVKIGSEVRDLKIGDKVAVFHHVPCLACHYCLNENFSQCKFYKEVDTTAGFTPSGGGFAEYVKLPEAVVKLGSIKIPPEISYEEAVFIEPTNCCVKGIKKADVQLGDYVMVLGQGPIGLTFVQLAKLCGATVISTDLVDYRLEAAKQYGADYIFNAQNKNMTEEIKKITDGRGVDAAIVAVESVKAMEQAIKTTRNGGKVIIFGESAEGEYLELDPNIIYGREIDLIGSYSSSFREHKLSANLIFEKKIRTTDMITHRIKLKDLSKAIDLADKRRDHNWSGRKIKNKIQKSLKIIIEP